MSATNLLLLLATGCPVLQQAPWAVSNASGPKPREPAPTAIPRAPDAAGAPRVRQLALEENHGQCSDRALFVSRGGPLTTFLTADGLAFQQIASPPRHRAGEAGAHGASLFFTFEGASSSARPDGLEELSRRHHWIKGDAPGRWATHVPTYTRAALRGLYPGVDLELRASGSDLEYDLTLEPGADLRQIVLRCEGADSLSIDEEGSLLARTSLGTLRQRPPSTYEATAAGQRTPRASRFVLLDPIRVSFDVKGRDPHARLVIDPGLAYSTFLGGLSGDTCAGVVVDSLGSAFVTGYTFSAGFPTTSGAFDITQNGSADAYLTKLDPTGSSVIFSTFLGGGGDDEGIALTTDVYGDFYLTGQVGSANFPTTPGAFQTTVVGPPDAFITKMTPDGSALLYSTILGAPDISSFDQPAAIAADAYGHAFVTGLKYNGGPFPTTPGTFDTTYAGLFNGYSDAWVTKLNPAGTSLIYSTYLGGLHIDAPTSIVVDPSGDAIVAGYTYSTDFPITAGALQPTLNSSADAFITRFNSLGSALVYSTYLGGSGYDIVFRIALEPVGRLFACGYTNSADFPVTPGAFQTVPASSGPSNGDGFVAQLAASGNTLVWSTYIGGSLHDGGLCLAVGETGDICLGGVSHSPDFPMTLDAFDPSYNGGTYVGDVVLAKLDSTGSGLIYSTYLGGVPNMFGVRGDEYAGDVALGPDGAAYVVGYTYGEGFPTTPGAFDTTFNSPTTTDGFVTKLELPELPMGLSSYGREVSGCAGLHRLSASASPRINSPKFKLLCANAPPSSQGLVLAGNAAAPQGPDLFALGVPIYVSLASTDLLLFDILSNGFGNAKALAPIPDLPALVGQTYYAQALWYWPSGPCTPSTSLLSASGGLAIQFLP